MFCSKCGTEVPAEGAFCYKCGSTLHPNADVASPKAPSRPWWQQEVAIAWAMILVFPLGILLMWFYAPWRQRFKWLWTGIAVFLTLVVIAGVTAPDETHNSSAKISEVPAATESSTQDAAGSVAQMGGTATNEPGTPTPDATTVARYIEAVATQQAAQYIEAVATQQAAQYIQAVATQQAAQYIETLATAQAEATRVAPPTASQGGIVEIWQKCRGCPSGIGLTTDLTFIARDLVDSLKLIVSRQLHPKAAIVVIYVDQDTQRDMFGWAPEGMPGKWGDHYPVAAILVAPWVEPPWDEIDWALDNKAVLCWATDQFLNAFIYMALDDPECLLFLGSSDPGDWLEPYSPTR